MAYHDDLARVQQALDGHLREGLERRAPVVRQPPMARLARELGIDGLIREGGLTGQRLTEFLDVYLANAVHIQHPANMGHQVACPHPSGVLGGLIDAFTNNPMAIYEMGPSAATVEYALINWMLEKAGWRPAPWPGEEATAGGFGAGVLTHGGSLAQLTALAAARAHADPGAWERGVDPHLVVIAPDDAHYSVSRALGVLGMGQKALLPAPCADDGRIVPDKLDALIRQTRASGKKIMAVVANAGCTAAGLYDDLETIGDLCAAQDVWLHVDGAHGASALLSKRHGHLMKGVWKASSLIWDAHKMMRTPGLCAAVLFPDHRHIDHAFSQQASYLFHDKEQTGFDAITRTIECTKAGIGLKFFMGLAAQGEAGLAQYVDDCFALGRRAAELIASHPDFELAIAPQANIVCFRLKGLSDDAQLQLRKKLLAGGQSYVTTTMFAARRWLRFTFMNPATTLEDVKDTLNRLQELA